MGEMMLLARDYLGPAQWRWVLTTADGAFEGSHEVRLDEGSWQYEAFDDLPRYLRGHVVPERRIEDQARIVADVGRWIGEQVLGSLGVALVAAAPVTVRVVVSREAVPLTFRPLELAHVNGKALALHGVTLIMEASPWAGTDSGSRSTHAGGPLRVLGLFSLPTGERPLNLRRERQVLVNLFSRMAAMGAAVEMRALQYGVTREKLKAVLAEGWDVVHVAGHGKPGELLLETDSGSPDPVTGPQLTALLGLTQARLKLVTVSACWSAALTAADQRRQLGLPRLQADQSDRHDEPEDTRAAGALAADLARLGCAVLAMRFQTTDDFAIALAERLYSLIAWEEKPLPRALGIALNDVVPASATAARPALSAASPALFGSSAASLALTVPRRPPPEPGQGTDAIPGFPTQPDLFVGRIAVMTRASMALAPRSGEAGVIFYGMPGGGKTACALELAYTHRDAFDRLAWFKVPDDDLGSMPTFRDFVLLMETVLPGLRLMHLLDDPGELAAYLPILTGFCERSRILLVIDNVESLLTESGQWRDSRWEAIVRALTAHTGLGRVLLTSRRLPDGIGQRLRTEPVDALPLDEALLLARELPHLGRLMAGSIPGIPPGTARTLATQILKQAHGHPELMELANGQASDIRSLQRLLDSGDRAWKQAGGLPAGFFTTGEPHAGGDDYLHVLSAWTNTVVETLNPGQRGLFLFLACIGETDRIRTLAEVLWPYLWRSLGHDSEALPFDTGVAALAGNALITVRPTTPVSYGIHPAVAAHGRKQAGEDFQQAVDYFLAIYWSAIAQGATRQETEETEGVERAGELLVHAALSAVPYLLRRQQWDEARRLLDEAIIRDQSSAVMKEAALPHLRTITAALEGTPTEPAALVTLGRALARHPATAIPPTQKALTTALALEDYSGASTAAESLANYLMRSGRLPEALAYAEAGIDYARRSGAESWSLIRLDIMLEMGKPEEVFDEVIRLRAKLGVSPDPSAGQPQDVPWEVWEDLLRTGRRAASALGRWQDCLILGEALRDSMRSRGAPLLGAARALFEEYGPLLRLGRIDDAAEVLRMCRGVAEHAQDLELLRHTLGALASVESARERHDIAVGLEREALRYAYLAGDPQDIAGCHHNLAHSYAVAGQHDTALPHCLAAAVIAKLTGGPELETELEDAAFIIRRFRITEEPVTVPAGPEELSGQVAELPGIDLASLLTQVAPGQDTIRQALEEVTARASAQPDRMPVSARERWLAAWDPHISALAAAQDGDAEAAATVDRDLTALKNSDEFSILGHALSRIRAGERGPEVLAGLSDKYTAVAARALDVLAGRADVPADLWRAIGHKMLMSDMVTAATGHHYARKRVLEAIETLAREPGNAALAQALRQILAGYRDPDIANGLPDPMQRAIVASVLQHIGASMKRNDPPRG